MVQFRFFMDVEAKLVSYPYMPTCRSKIGLLKLFQIWTLGNIRCNGKSFIEFQKHLFSSGRQIEQVCLFYVGRAAVSFSKSPDMQIFRIILYRLDHHSHCYALIRCWGIKNERAHPCIAVFYMTINCLLLKSLQIK